jgi:hypothetical protein
MTLNLLIDYKNQLLREYKEEKATKTEKKLVVDISDLVLFLESLDYNSLSNKGKIDFDSLIQILITTVNILLVKFTSNCNYMLSKGSKRPRKLDCLVYSDNTNDDCDVIDVLIPKFDNSGNYIIYSNYDATNGILNTSIEMSLEEPTILNEEYDKNKVNVENMIKDIIKSIIGETTITEFTMTGETSGEILSYNPSQTSQPPSTYAYGTYKKLKTVITDKNIKLNLKIHNPTQGFKITHLINVPQTYTNCYAQKEPNYEKI